VLIADAREEEDAERRFAAVARIQPRETRQEAMVRAESAAALTELERFDEAEEEARLAREAAPDFGRAREVSASLVVARSRRAWLAGQAVDREALLKAGEELIALRDEHRELKAFGGSVSFLVAAADAYWLADTPEETARLLAPDELLAEELELPQARQLLGEAAIRVGHPAYALAILPESEVTGDVDRLIRAAAASFVGDREALEEAIQVLDGIVSGGGPLATFAARQRLLVAADRSQGWSDTAETLLSKDDLVLAAVFKARWLASGGLFDDAEKRCCRTATSCASSTSSSASRGRRETIRRRRSVRGRCSPWRRIARFGSSAPRRCWRSARTTGSSPYADSPTMRRHRLGSAFAPSRV